MTKLTEKTYIGGAGRNSSTNCSGLELMTNLPALSTMKNFNLQNLSEAIQAHLDENNISPRDFAKEADVSHQLVYKVLQAEKDIMLGYALKMAEKAGFEAYLTKKWGEDENNLSTNVDK